MTVPTHRGPNGRRNRVGGRLAPLTVVVVAVSGMVAACGGDVPVSPLPVQPPSAAATRTPTPPVTSTPPASPPPGTPVVVPTSRRPAPVTSTSVRTPPATRSPSGLPGSCHGAVRYDLVLAETELALLTSLCFATGGVLRIIGIGPGEVTVDREDLVSRSYEGGVVDVRFVRPGTVVVRIPQDGTTYPVTVVVR
ncbi:hypothetical protein [Micromonospora inyonensis]|uniref:Uncharacterized protein n=1 Tax=Micromonospora inyonensis TaxID=47866 RepID=A0A1C6SKG5_9ACTN|nr:hypothetical protein [Micromonospora inyonensis]SCL29903.1 hypothetical protein GA0074694_5538 [Micromonospora inyonensis]